ncbi:diguanylate cyclase (GGDEF) domain-containing protein [Persephonella hydrogeniphila]|uniref:Diguanylate cyclase (GGDEF) domain-containing protein n=1 Tax=Persephonella hydrogeniphila TaxID=198703 RepID=A0A285NJW3_9AQUI|nr:EAL domain-containing protein [Persephonella hydrogeniphila]SNZ08166.1 diguanylate cyclase (GGDEF) domain-containing protein [Persephonella hydrogeniphila]
MEEQKILEKTIQNLMEDPDIKIFLSRDLLETTKNKLSELLKNLPDFNNYLIEKKLTDFGSYIFETGVPVKIFSKITNILENILPFSQNMTKNYMSRGYLIQMIRIHKEAIFPVYLQMENMKEIKMLEHFRRHLLYLLQVITAIEEEMYYQFEPFDEKKCPLHNWLTSDEATKIFDKEIKRIKNIHNSIHRLSTLLLERMKNFQYYSAVKIYDEIFKNSLHLLFYSRSYTENLLTEKKEKLQKIVRKLRSLSEQDTVTRIHNDIRLFKVLKIHMRSKKEFYIAIFDIDDFRYINQVYGFKIGNILLKEVAKTLESFKSKYKILNFKTGSNSFVSIIFEKNVENIIKDIKKSTENIELDVKIDTHSVKFYPKLTAAYLKVDNFFSSPDEVLEILDIVLYRGKRENKGSIVSYDKKKDSKIEVAKCLDKQIFLGYAIKENKIKPFFQPIFNIKTGEILGFEALFRIERDGEIYPAGDFINIAYKTGLIAEVDKLITKYILSNMDILNRYTIFLNISPQTLKEKWFVESARYLDNCVFEITEQMAFENINKLKMLNIETSNSMALDDFGSGYSSIKTVVELASHNVISFLKIDGAIIRDIDKNRESFFIVESIVKIAKTLSLKTVAEFIENKRILEIIRNLQIDYAQGFYLGKPSPITEINNFKILKTKE